MKKGFYLLQPKSAEHFEGLLEAIKDLNEGGIWLCFPHEDKSKGMSIEPFTVWFDTIEKEGKFYIRMRTRNEGKKIVSEKLIPSSKGTPKNFFAPIRNYLDQKLKKEKLTETILKDEELAHDVAHYREIHSQKIEVIGRKEFENAKELVCEEIELSLKIVIAAKEKFCTQPGFKWVTRNHILDILEDPE
jgi:hypothetical protein